MSNNAPVFFENKYLASKLRLDFEAEEVIVRFDRGMKLLGVNEVGCRAIVGVGAAAVSQSRLETTGLPVFTRW